MKLISSTDSCILEDRKSTIPDIACGVDITSPGTVMGIQSVTFGAVQTEEMKDGACIGEDYSELGQEKGQSESDQFGKLPSYEVSAKSKCLSVCLMCIHLSVMFI